MSEVKATRDGKIREIKVSVGETVRKNQEILSIESPRLTTLILSTEMGIVENLAVKSGDLVKAGQLLARIRENNN